MKFRNHLLAGLVLMLLPAWSLACSCAPGSMGFCQSLPDTSNANHAVFIGKVTEVYPKSRADMNRLVDEFVRTHHDLLEALRTQSPNTTGRVVAGAGASSAEVEWRRQIIEYVWRDLLTPTERQQLRAATDRQELNRLDFDQRRRVHLDLVENFAGADEEQFTLYTALDGPACGFDFAEGETYLVEAYRAPGSDTWRVSSCSRTRLLVDATEDLKTLGAWKAGQRLPGRISGQILDRRTPPAHTPFQVRLLGGKQVLETTSDSLGRFGFENLDAGVYQVELGQPPALSRPADLTRAWCAMVILPIGP